VNAHSVRNFSAVAVLAGAALIVSDSASATLFTETFTGKVNSQFGGTDVAGIFGATGASLVGDAWTAVFTYDTSVGQDLELPGLSRLRGGSAFGQPTDASVVFTLNGVSVGFAGIYASQIAVGTPGFAGGEVVDLVLLSHDNSVSIFVDTAPAPANLTTFYQNLSVNELDVGAFNLSTYNPVQNLYVAQAFANLDVSTVTITAAAVPEPPAWTIILIGFGAIVLTKRIVRRKNATVTVA
jgi:hypothetical protein